MPRYDWVHANFTAGEVTPRLHGRLDFDRLYDGARTVENFICLPHGGVMRRPGTCYVADALSDTNATRLMGFVFSQEQAYVLEWGHQTLRWFQNRGQLIADNTDGVIANGTFDADVASWTDKSAGTGAIVWDSALQAMRLEGTVGDTSAGEQSVAVSTTEELVLVFRVRTLSRDDYVQVRVGSTSGATDILAEVRRGPGWHAIQFSTGGTDPIFLRFTNSLSRDVWVDDVELLSNAPLQVGTPYRSAELFSIQKTQSADVLFLQHPTYRPYELQRLGTATWSLIEHDFEDGPYFDTNITSTTLTPSGTSGNITLTASSITGINGGSGFLETDVGRLVRLQISSTWGWVEITAWTSTTVVSAVVRGSSGLAAATATASWRLGAWSDTTGWPATGTFHEERLVRAATADNPQSIWFSRSNAFNQHDPSASDGTVTDSHGIAITVASDEVNAVVWMASAPAGLVVGTTSNEFLITATEGQVVTPTTIQAKQQTNHGSEQDIPIARIGHSILFVQRSGRTVREIAFSFEADGLQTRDLGILSEHLLRLGVTDVAYQQLPFSILWGIRADGQLLGMTFERDHKVFAWHRHKMGGDLEGSWPIVDSIATIPVNDYDELWLTVKRTVGGVTKRHVVVMDLPYECGMDLGDVCLTDDAIHFEGAETALITGLGPLECGEVAIIGDGAVLPSQQVYQGAVTLTSPVSDAEIGFPFTAILDLLPFDAGTEGQTTRGKWRRIHQAHVYFDTTLGGEYGFVTPNGCGDDVTEQEFFPFDFRSVTDPMDIMPPIFSGLYSVPMRQQMGRKPVLRIRTSDPLPMTINSVILDAEVHGS